MTTGLAAGLLALAGRLFPAPELIITLSAPPEVLLQRKQELSEPEIRRQAATLSALKFSAPVLATADADTLQEVIEVVMLSADRIEKELTGKDEF